MASEWMTEDDAAEWLGVPTKEVRQAVSDGELPGLRIGGQVRLSRTALIALAGAEARTEARAGSATSRPSRLAANGHTGLAAPAGFDWRSKLAVAEAFKHHWPSGKGDSSVEDYPRAWSATISLGGAELRVLAGETTGSARRDRKPRLTVLFNNYPMAEFVPTADGKGWASLIKPDGRHSVAPSGALPRLYRDARVAPYHQATGLSGRGRPSGAAVIIDRDDITSAVHHAAARWLGRSGQPVEPARS